MNAYQSLPEPPPTLRLSRPSFSQEEHELPPRRSRRRVESRQTWLTLGDEKELSDEDIEHESRRELQRRVAMLSKNVNSLELQVNRMAQQLARHSIGSSSVRSSRMGTFRSSREPKEPERPPENIFLNSLGNESRLNPLGERFDYIAWIKNLTAIGRHSSTQRSLSFAFRNLSVSGVRASTSYQMDVYTTFLSLQNVVRWLAGSREDRVEILQGFDGRIESGEMLLVLGRPGSGCSTLLKTLAGDMNGIDADAESYLNFQGEYEPLLSSCPDH